MTLEEQKTKQIAFLDQTVAFYSQDPDKLRGGGIIGSSISFAPHGTSPGCAIGRHLSPEFAKELDAIKTLGEMYSRLEAQGPPDITMLGLRFIKAMMFFHDCNEFWTSKGLSSEGWRRVKELHEQINSGDFQNRWYD